MATKTAKGFVCVHVIKHTAQGLFVERDNGQSQFMDDLGGKVYVLKSHILSGSLFVLEFPIRL